MNLSHQLLPICAIFLLGILLGATRVFRRPSIASITALLAVLGYLAGSVDSRRWLVELWSAMQITLLGVVMIAALLLCGAFVGSMVDMYQPDRRRRDIALVVVLAIVVALATLGRQRSIFWERESVRCEVIARRAVEENAEVARLVGGTPKTLVHRGGISQEDPARAHYILSATGYKRDLYVVVDVDRSSRPARAAYRCVFDRSIGSLDASVRDYCAASANAQSDELKALLQER